MPLEARILNYPIKVACLRFYTLKGQTPLSVSMIISTTCYTPVVWGRKAIMLPHQTRKVFLSWFLLHYITLSILAGNLCPPESLGSVSLYPGMLNTFCLLM